MVTVLLYLTSITVFPAAKFLIEIRRRSNVLHINPGQMTKNNRISVWMIDFVIAHRWPFALFYLICTIFAVFSIVHWPGFRLPMDERIQVDGGFFYFNCQLLRSDHPFEWYNTNAKETFHFSLVNAQNFSAVLVWDSVSRDFDIGRERLLRDFAVRKKNYD